MAFQIKATEQYFPVVLFVMLYKVVPIVESVDGLSFGTVDISYCAM